MAKSKDRISGITVRGFKSIGAEQHMVIRPLTVLAGANSSGKSSFMQPLLLLKQTLESPGDPGALLLDGPNVRFTMADQVLTHTSGRTPGAEFAVRLELLQGRSFECVFRREEKKGFAIPETSYRSGQERSTITPGMKHDEIVKLLPEAWKTMHKTGGEIVGEPLHWIVARDRCFLTFGLASADESKGGGGIGPFDVSPSQVFVPLIQGVIHLPGLRGNPRRDYPRAAGGPNFPGTFEPYVASVIAQWEANKDKEKLGNLAKALEAMGLTWKVRTERVDDTRVELKVGRLPHSKQGGAHDLVSIADVGFGVSQSLPVVVALLAARPGQLVYLEQPEIHLHPLAQRRLAGIFRDAVKRGVIAVVETHSALLVREVQTLIAKGELRKEHVAMHWVQRDERGETTVKMADLDDNGAYGDWPEDFDRTELEAEREYLDQVEAKGAGQ